MERALHAAHQAAAGAAHPVAGPRRAGNPSSRVVTTLHLEVKLDEASLPQSHDPRVAASSLERLQEDLQLKKTSVYRSIPYSRFGSNRDAHCYRKAYPHLLAFKVG